MAFKMRGFPLNSPQSPLKDRPKPKNQLNIINVLKNLATTGGGAYAGHKISSSLTDNPYIIGGSTAVGALVGHSVGSSLDIQCGPRSKKKKCKKNPGFGWKY